jgi:vitamin K-dependent gamma-carboxylase
MRARQSFLNKLQERAFAPVDVASLVFFRIAFGLLLVWHVSKYFVHHTIYSIWLAPRFLFKYYGFSWVHPWPGDGLYIHWAALDFFALFIALGFLYRINAALFFLSYTYFFLLDEARFVNHTYLICLFSFLLIFVPANRAWSVDAWLNPKIRSHTTPAWMLWLLRAQIGVVYFFAGLAKIAPDWLQGEPMRWRLSHRGDFPVLGRFFRNEWAVYTVSYSALLLDLFLVPLLLWRRTRVPAFCVAVLFHLINGLWFTIGIFPWLAIAATTLFFSPSWPRRILGLFRRTVAAEPTDNWRPPSYRKQIVVLGLVGIYLAIQFLLPLRHLLWPGGVEWIYAEHRFSWRMMLVRQYSQAFFYVTDPNSGRTVQVKPAQFLGPRQNAMLGYLPDIPLQFAHYLASVIPRSGPKPLRVEARILVSINGRKPQLYLDPNVDLAAESRTLGRPRWVLRIDEPLPHDEKYSGGNVVAPSDAD